MRSYGYELRGAGGGAGEERYEEQEEVRAKGKEPPEGVNQFFLRTWCFSTSTQCSRQRNNRNSQCQGKNSDGQHQID